VAQRNNVKNGENVCSLKKGSSAEESENSSVMQLASWRKI